MFLITALLLASSAPNLLQSESCAVSGEVSAVDGARAREACQTARARFSELFGVVAPRLEIVLRSHPGYRVSDVGQGARVYWPTSVALMPTGVDAPIGDLHVASQWRDVLPHEAMHAMVAAHFFAAGDDLSAAYGTPLPDWFEEAVAIWAEPESQRGLRLAQARNLPPELRVLSGILATPHPAADNPALLAARDGAALPRWDRALWAFYPQAIAVLRFVHDAGGAAAVQVLAARLLAGHASDATVLAGLPGMPAEPADVIVAWERWLPASATVRRGVGAGH